MTNRERIHAILHYKDYDRMPIVHFGFSKIAYEKWAREGHTLETDGEAEVAKKLGFDMGWGGFSAASVNYGLMPGFEQKVLETREDGFVITQTGAGQIMMTREGAGSIPPFLGSLLETREDWEKLYLPKLQWSDERIKTEHLKKLENSGDWTEPRMIHCGSLYGNVRNMLSIEGLSYLFADDEDLVVEMLNTVAELCFKGTESILKQCAKFDYGHFWEDICFKNGPLVNPKVFRKYCGPNYRKITDLLLKYGIDIVSLDCDGMIDELLPIWLENGVNTMFPIEVGTWGSSIEPWRKKYGKALLGVGGMDKRVFAKDYKAVDDEIERLRRLVDLGGFIPCPDHRLPPETKWENVQYYCEKMREIM